jgi:phage internal scaffolding protein
VQLIQLNLYLGSDMTRVKNPITYDRDKNSDLAKFVFVNPSRTKQSFRDECDINNILRQFNVTGQLPIGSVQPQYGDFSGITDYQSALNAVMAAQDSFLQLPAKLRARFDNDPALFVEFASDEANKDEMKALGLLRQETAQAVVSSPSEAVKAEPAQ